MNRCFVGAGCLTLGHTRDTMTTAESAAFERTPVENSQ
jgi:hypothetical protein